MGKKQQAILANVTAAEHDCKKHADGLGTAVAAIIKLQTQVVAEKDHTKKDAIRKQIDPHGLAMLTSRTALQKSLPGYKAEISTLKTFVAQKSKRWVGKSTLPAAKTALTGFETTYTNYETLITDSVAINLRV